MNGTKKRSKNLLLRLAVCAFVVYIASTLISQQIQIKKSRTQLASLKAQYQTQEDQNGEIQRVLSEKDDQFIESVARDKLGYAKTNERIYVNVSGN